MESVGLTSERQPSALRGSHVNVPKTDRSHPGKQRHHRLWGSACVSATDFQVSSAGQEGARASALGLVGDCSKGAAVRRRLMLQLSWRRAPRRLVPRGLTVLLLGRWGKAPARPPLLWMLPEQTGRRLPSALPSLSPHPANPDVWEGKSPRWSHVAERPMPLPNLATMVTPRPARHSVSAACQGPPRSPLLPSPCSHPSLRGGALHPQEFDSPLDLILFPSTSCLSIFYCP